jgi:hypothetical protein
MASFGALPILPMASFGAGQASLASFGAVPNLPMASFGAVGFVRRLAHLANGFVRRRGLL